jgi:D-xylose transport system substrate-binding protein
VRSFPRASTRDLLAAASLALSIALGAALARANAPGAADGGRGPLLIGFSLDTLKEERWQRDRELFAARVRELGGEPLIQDANSDDTRQMQDVQALISRRVRALVIVPHNGAAMAKAVALAHEAGIPVVAYDRLVTGADLDLYVAFDSVRIGEAQARTLLAKLAGRRPIRLVRINGAKTDSNSFMIRDGQDRVLKPLIASGAVTILHEDWAENWRPENAKKIMNAALTRYGGGIDAVLAANDGTAGGAIQALSEEGLASKVLVAGADAELVACQRIAAGTQALTVYTPISKIAFAAADAAVRMANGRAVTTRDEVDNEHGKVPAILLDVIPVAREDLLATVIHDGYNSYDDVFRGIPESRRPKRP